MLGKKNAIRFVCLLAGWMIACMIGWAGAEERVGDPSLIRIEQQEVKLARGKTVSLTTVYDPSVQREGSKIQWHSGDLTVATVNSGGVVTAVSRGETTIYCDVLLKTDEVLRAETHVEVIQEAEKIFIRPDGQITVGYGREMSLSYEMEPSDVSFPGVVWTSADSSIASVDPDGTVHGVSAGKTRISAAAEDGYGASAYIEVQVSPVYADTAEITLDSQEVVDLPIHYEGSSFEEEYLIEVEGNGVSYTVDAEEETAVFHLRPAAASEETVLKVESVKNHQYQTTVRIHVEESAICDAQKLPVVSAQILSGTGALTYRLELTNNSTEEIGEIGFLVDYRDQFGDTHYLISNTDGTLQNFQYTTMFNILPGQTLPVMGRTEAFRSDDIIKEVRLAVFYYRYVESGKKVYIPADRLYWFSSKTGEMERPENGQPYEAPDVDTKDRADRITYNLLATMCDLYPYVSKPFCRSYRAGKYLSQVGENGWARAWGLRAQDVIYGADDMLWEEDPFFLDRAFARVYDGEKVTLKVVRNGEEIEMEISKDMGVEK